MNIFVNKIMDNLVGIMFIISGIIFYWFSSYRIFRYLDIRGMERDKRFLNTNLKIVI